MAKKERSDLGRTAEVEREEYKERPSGCKVPYSTGVVKKKKMRLEELIREGSLSTNVSFLKWQGFNLYLRCIFLLLESE